MEQLLSCASIYKICISGRTSDGHEYIESVPYERPAVGDLQFEPMNQKHAELYTHMENTPVVTQHTPGD